MPQAPPSSTALDIEAQLHWIERIHAEDASLPVLTGLAEFLSTALDGGYVSMHPFMGHPETMGSIHVSSARDRRFDELPLGFYPDGMPWLEQVLDRPGQLLHAKDLITEQEVRASAFYREFMAPQGFLPTEALGSYHTAPTGAPGFGWAIHGVRPFRRAEIEFCQRLDPHLATACMRRAARLRCEHDLAVARQALDSAPIGIVQIDRSGGIGWVSKAMRRILAANDGLRVVDGALRADLPAEQEAIDRLVQRAFDGSDPGPPAALTRSEGRRPLGVLLAPAAANPELPVGVMAGNLLVIDPELHTATPGPLLKQLYGLTPAEVRLALAIAGGTRPADFAAQTERSLETIRAQLKSVFRKVGVRRQADLARVVGMIGAILPIDAEVAQP